MRFRMEAGDELQSSESDDEFIVIERNNVKSVKKGQPKQLRSQTPNRTRPTSTSKRKARTPKTPSTQVNVTDESGLLTTVSNHCDPSNKEVVEWMLEDKWSNLKQYHVDKDSHLEKLLEACTLIQTRPECTPEIRNLTHTITRNAMALTDRFALECELMRQTVNDELIDNRRSIVAFLDAYRQEDTKHQSTTKITDDALRNVLKINSALRGVYPDVSLAHPHPIPSMATAHSSPLTTTVN